MHQLGAIVYTFSDCVSLQVSVTITASGETVTGTKDVEESMQQGKTIITHYLVTSSCLQTFQHSGKDAPAFEGSSYGSSN